MQKIARHILYNWKSEVAGIKPLAVITFDSMVAFKESGTVCNTRR